MSVPWLMGVSILVGVGLAIFMVFNSPTLEEPYDNRRRRNNYSQQPDINRNTNASPSSLSQLRCTICLQSYSKKSEILELTCKHKFHQNCILTHFTTKGTDKCSICGVENTKEWIM